MSASMKLEICESEYLPLDLRGRWFVLRTGREDHAQIEGRAEEWERIAHALEHGDPAELSGPNAGCVLFERCAASLSARRWRFWSPRNTFVPRLPGGLKSFVVMPQDEAPALAAQIRLELQKAWPWPPVQKVWP